MGCFVIAETVCNRIAWHKKKSERTTKMSVLLSPQPKREPAASPCAIAGEPCIIKPEVCPFVAPPIPPDTALVFVKTPESLLTGEEAYMATGTRTEDLQVMGLSASHTQCLVVS
jgi:hypothetical protein